MEGPMPDLQDIAERLSQLPVLEAAELSRLLEDKWGVSASAPVAVQVAQQEAAPAPVEERTEFNVILNAVHPDKKITVIKEVRSITGLGLKEAKEFTESAGPNKVLKEAIAKAEAESIKKRMEDAGATITIH